MTQTTGGIQTECIICLQLADQAIVTKCCTTIMCYSPCFQQVKDLPNGCPNCRKMKPDFDGQAQSMIRKFIIEISLEILLTVRLLNGMIISLRLKELESTQALYNRISERSSINLQEISLVFQSKNIQPSEKSLRSLKIQNGSNLLQVLRMSGGLSVI